MDQRPFRGALSPVIGYDKEPDLNQRMPMWNTSVKLAQPISTTIFISTEPLMKYVFSTQFGVADSEPRIIFDEFELYHGEIWNSNFEVAVLWS